jgi:excisionase family DNA binding protein
LSQIFNHRDWFATTDLLAHTYAYGGGHDGHGIQLSTKPDGKDPYAIRLPADKAQALARAILATYDPADTGPDRLMKPAEVAALFGVDPKTVGRWARTGRLTAVRTPGGHCRFRESDVDKLAGRRQP